MSTTTHHHAHLRQLSGDPTNTEGIRERFLREVRRRFRQFRGRVRAVVGYDEDRLHLAADARLADADDIERFPSDDGKIRAFVRWLREQFDEDVLEPAGQRPIRNGEHWTGTYIRAAYSRGWENAVQRLQNEGIDIPDGARQAFDTGVSARQLGRLYSRTFETLATVREDVADEVRETLADGLAAGWNPRKMADHLAERVRVIQHTQAEVLARTEVINSYSEATLDRYEQSDAGAVTLSGEFATAEDDRVCPICEALAGDVFDIDEMREATFAFDPSESEPDHLAGEYPVKPPVHPQCRCAILPVVE